MSSYLLSIYIPNQKFAGQVFCEGSDTFEFLFSNLFLDRFLFEKMKEVSFLRKSRETHFVNFKRFFIFLYSFRVSMITPL